MYHAVAKSISCIALLVTIIPSLLCFAGLADQASVRWLALAGTIAWFASTPLWMGHDLPPDAAEVEI